MGKLWGGNKPTDMQTDTHINTMNRPGQGAGPSENQTEGGH